MAIDRAKRNSIIVKTIMEHQVDTDTKVEISHLSGQIICECGDWFSQFINHANHVALQVLDALDALNTGFGFDPEQPYIDVVKGTIHDPDTGREM